MRERYTDFASRLHLWGPALLLAAALPAGAIAQTQGFSTLILSPEPGEVVGQTTTMVALSFIDPGRILDVTSVRLLVDNIDRTGDADINADVLIWMPSAALVQGIHSVVVTMRSTTGTQLPTTNWSFVVGPPPEGVAPGAVPEPAAGRVGLPGWAMLRGSLKLEGLVKSIGGDGADFRRESPAAGKAWLNINGRLGGGWRYDAYTHLNSYESHTRQPINRFRLGVRSRWLTLALGDVTPTVQQLILWGRRVRGWSLDLRTGLFNIEVVSGRSRRAVEGQLFSNDPTRVFRRGTYGQDLLAVRPYFGDGTPWQFGITLMKVRDDVDSIEDLRTFDPADQNFASVSANSTPKDNLVLGLDFTLSAFGRRLSLTYDNAFSLYANDISGGPLTKAELDSVFQEAGYKPVDFDPAEWESIFILNSSLIPLDPSQLTNMAHQLRGTLLLGTHTLGFRWRRVGGSYYTLGQTSLQRDRAGLRIQDTFRMMKNTLGVTVGWESYSDNLDETKPGTTDTGSLTLDVAWQPDPLSPGFAIGYRTYNRQNDLSTVGAGGVQEDTNTYSAGAFIPVRILSGLRSRINLNWTSVGREDKRNSQTGTNNRYYLLGFASRFEDRPTEFSLTYGLNTSDLTGFANAETTFNRVLLKGRHGLNNRLFATGDLMLTTASSPEPASGQQVMGLKYTRTEFTVGGEYYWTTTSYASLRAGFGSYTDNRRTGLDTTEFTLRLRLVRSF